MLSWERNAFFLSFFLSFFLLLLFYFFTYFFSGTSEYRSLWFRRAFPHKRIFVSIFNITKLYTGISLFVCLLLYICVRLYSFVYWGNWKFCKVYLLKFDSLFPRPKARVLIGTPSRFLINEVSRWTTTRKTTLLPMSNFLQVKFPCCNLFKTKKYRYE